MRLNIFKKVDRPLLLMLLMLLGYGLAVLYSASGASNAVITKQCINVALGLTALVIASNISPETYQRFAPLLYIGGLVLLILVMVVGTHAKGAQRWLNLGFFRFQPSEIMKFALPLMVAWYFHHKPLPPRFSNIVVSAVLIAIPSLLIIKQPDLGSGLMVAASGIYILFFAGLRWKFIFGCLATACAALPLVWSVMHDYQRQRVLTLLNPESDPLGAGYHIIQSKIAIGSGGLWGKGFMAGTQSQLKFLPERTTDFIFAVLSEEFGLAGVVLLLCIYIGIIWRGLTLAAEAQSPFSRLLAGALILTFFTYLFVNIGMVSGILPVVGVPLPLVSAGGTAMISLLGAFGVVMAQKSHRRLMSD